MRRILGISLVLVSCVFLSMILACGGGSPAIGVSLTGSSSTVDAGAGNVTITATIANDSKNGGVTFTLVTSPTTGGCGTGTITTSGTPVTSATYTPPLASVLTKTCTATITAASVTNPAITSTFTVTINPITVTFVTPPTTLTLGAGAPPITLTAALGNEAATTDVVNWTFSTTGGGTPLARRKSALVIPAGCGTFAPSTTGQQLTAVYTPPLATLPSQCTATITAASTINPGISTTIIFTVNPITVTLTPPASTTVIEGATSGALTAVMTNNGSTDTQLDWSVTPSGCGTVSPTNGITVTYKPAGCSGTNAVTVTAYSDANFGASASANFTITPIAVSTSPNTAQTLVEGATLPITASTNDPAGTASLTWSLSPLTGCGKLSGTGASNTYTAPTSLTTTCTATVTVTSATDSSKTATLGLTVNPIAVSITSPTTAPTVLSGSAALPITATTNDPALASSLNWTLAPATSCGSLSPATGASVSYTPPLLLAAQCTATATVASKTDPTKTATLTVTVTPAPIVVTVNPVVDTLLEGATLSVTATIYNDATAAGIAYTLTPNNCGTFSGLANPVVSGATTTYTGTYTAPKSNCSPSLVLLSRAAPAATATLTITVNPITVAITAPTTAPSVLSGSGPIPFTATTNDPAGASTLTWTVTPVAPAISCGRLTPQPATGTSVSYIPPVTLGTACSDAVTVASSTDSSRTASMTVTVTPAPLTLTLTSPASLSVGLSGTSTVTATLYNNASGQGIGFTLAPVLPATSCGTFNGMTLQSTAGATSYYIGTYTAPSSPCSVALILTSLASSGATATVNITVQPGISVSLIPAGPLSIDANSGPLQITPTILNDSANKGVNLALNPATGCGTLSVASSTGVSFSYNPPTTITSSCTVNLTATSISDSTKSATLALTVYPPLTLPATTVLATGTQGLPLTPVVNLNASGGEVPGNFTWTVSGLSNGLTSNAATNTGSTLTISGTPITATTVTFTAKVTDATGFSYGPITYMIDVNPYTLVSLPALSLPNATVGQTGYNAAINAVGGVATYHFTVTVNSVAYPVPTNNTPEVLGSTGLSANNSGGNTLFITGSPAGSAGSTITLNVAVIDGENNGGSGVYTIYVQPVSTIVISANDLEIDQGMATMPYTGSVSNNNAISGGNQPYSFSYTGLPAWATPDQYGNFTGTPTSAQTGTTSVTVTVTDTSSPPQSASATFNLTVVPLTTNTNNAMLSGQYACIIHQIRDSPNTVDGYSLYVDAIAVAFSSNGSGGITGGEADSNGPGSSGYSTTTGIVGSYAVGSDNRGYLTLGPSGQSPTTWALAAGTTYEGLYQR
ncbi:MAG: putative Ig domain-containing protein [Candidatus Korobacteraceae bacterium]